MSTNIKIPSSLHEAAEQLAQRLGVSLSELYAAALTAYIFSRQEEEVTEAH